MMSSQAYLQQANAQLQSLHGAALFFFRLSLVRAIIQYTEMRLLII